MRAVVTGSAGFIGGHLVALLESSGWDVIGIDRATGPSIEDWPRIPSADAIFHLASPVGPLGVLEHAGRIVRDVVTTTEIVATWARVNRCPLVYVSTSEVYGSGHADSESDPCTFAAPTSARKEYAVAKLAAETMLRNRAGNDVRIVRPFNVAGPGQRAIGGFVLPRFVAAALADDELTVYAPGTQVRAFAHVADIVRGLVAALERGTPGTVYNLGAPANACEIAALADEVVAYVGSGRARIIDPVALHGPAFREAPDKIPVIDRAERELGWFPVHDRASVIADTVEAMR